MTVWIAQLQQCVPSGCKRFNTRKFNNGLNIAQPIIPFFVLNFLPPLNTSWHIFVKNWFEYQFFWQNALVVNRKGSLSAFGRNFLFRLVPKHFGRISLLAERALTAEMLNFGGNAQFRPKYYCSLDRKKPLSAERRHFRPKQSYRVSHG